MVAAAAVVVVVVLARMGTSHIPAIVSAHSQSTTTTSTTVPGTATTTTTGSPAPTTTTLAPSSVTLLILNGWTREHAALYFQTELAGFGYDTLAPTDAATNTNKYSEMFVVHSRYEANAKVIAQSLGLSSSVVVAPRPTNDSAIPAADLGSADLIFVIGEDISSRVPPGYSVTTTTPAATTTVAATTVAATTTT